VEKNETLPTVVHELGFNGATVAIQNAHYPINSSASSNTARKTAKFVNFLL
jgi:hypothetical protein